VTVPDGGRDYSFVVSRKWIYGHIVALVAIVIFVNMGLWQIRRLHEKQAFNAILTSRTAVDPQPLDEVLLAFGPDQDLLELRSVVVTGQYRPDEEIILRSQSFNGVSGHHVLTPLDLGDGRVIIIDRGWVPIDLDEPGRQEFATPPGQVAIEGFLRKAEVRGSFGPVDPPQGTLAQIARVDIARLGRQVDGELVPVYVQLAGQEPPQDGSLPAVVPLPQPSEGPHRGYAVQWFLFTAVVLVGYPILLRKTAETGAAD
jgi:surfeit locus 1 family protein